ncbi:unnamed protein product [Mycena citricolor]|uniref:Uncharacterized protein n=1 Tax=Mycena citricolor TaxID=2018698 RepID=A0AAD2K5M8_9AGAR|nr:unnamed protein product [Mycena citricolor]
MSTHTSASNRASLLAGLRTGGVRSNFPQTAAPGASFNIPRLSVSQHSVYPEEGEGQMLFVNQAASQRAMPMTAAVDGASNRFLQQQNHGAFSPAFGGQANQAQAQALQMQLMQMEILRMQALQAQQYQAQFLAQSQTQRRPNFNPPATAGPTGSFNIHPQTSNAPAMRTLRPQEEGQVPMTAALGGKFGARAIPPMGRFSTEEYNEQLPVPPTPGTGVISGGTALGVATPVVPKSETASSWRRNGTNNSVLRTGNRPNFIKSSSPPRLSPPALGKTRPLPLQINSESVHPVPAVAVDGSEGENDDGYSTSSSESVASNSPPTTPRSSSSDMLSVSPPKQGKVLIAELGLGSGAPKIVGQRQVSQPTRQPRGPPSGADELGPRNFAGRVAVRVVVV